MERLTISLDDDLAAQFDQYLKEHGYKNRSEGMRDLIRDKLEQQSLEKQVKDNKPNGNCIGSITYIYNHHERELAARLAKTQHDNHNIAISSVKIPLDHDHCMETVMLNGATQKVREFCNDVIARPGIRHGKAYLIPVEVEHSEHEGKNHTHSTPKT
ncbi:nickel-responsive transcriptional regulator NikR [Gammaproteobacteria bacterium AS21]|jgi:CopG family nickel-responsive transcriptional regulator